MKVTTLLGSGSDHENSRVRRKASTNNATDHVTHSESQVSRSKEGDRFQSKRGKCGEAAENSCHYEKTGMGRYVAASGELSDYSDRETSENINK